MEDNIHFKYEVTQDFWKRFHVPSGQFTTVCVDCQYYSCHKSCGYHDNDDIKHCSAMDSQGYCKCCIGKWR